MRDILSTWAGVFPGLIGGLLFFFVLEAFTSRSKLGLLERAWGLWPWLVYLPVQSAFMVGVFAGMRAVGLKPIDLGLGGGFLALALYLLFKDFTSYWYHRGQHRFLWRWHGAHHSIQNMTAVNSYHHWSEIIMFTVAIAVPLDLFFPDVSGRNFFIGFIVGWHPIFLHSDTRLHLGPLGKWVIDNRFHRIHHSLDPRHFDKNFGVHLTIWDRMFGTAYVPTKDEWPDVGIAGVPEARTLGEWSNVPWRMPSAAEQPLHQIET